MEEWKDIEGYEGLYQVSEGEVKSLNYNKTKKERILKKSIVGGYYTVNLHKDGVMKTYYVHKLVAEAFIPNPDNLPCINHKDENKLNNYIHINEDGTVDLEKSNLEWCTVKYNTNYGTCIERRKEKITGEKHYLYGKHHTQEFKDMVSNKLKGRESPNKGKTASEETRMKMSLAHRKK